MGIDSIELDLRVPNRTRYLRLVGRIAEAFAWELEGRRQGKDLFARQLNMVLTEAMSNAILHAHGDDPEQTVQIHISISDGELRIRVYDRGRGFDLESVLEPDETGEDEHGRGIFIMRSLMDGVVYRKCEGYNVLEMWKRL